MKIPLPLQPLASPVPTLMLVLALGLATPTTRAASFACDKATRPVEKAVCGSAEVSELDDYLGRYYSAARQALAHADRCVVSDQRAWLRGVRDACADVACLRREYLARLAVLHALQPGASRLRQVALPAVPPLVWVVAPAADEVAAPRNRPVAPVVARGRLLNEVATGDGFVLQGADGTRQVLLSLMLLEQPSVDALAGLARLDGAQFEARGQRDRPQGRGDAPQAFAAGHCTYLYRLTP